MLTRWKNKPFSGWPVYKFNSGWKWRYDFDGDVFQTQAGVCVLCE